MKKMVITIVTLALFSASAMAQDTMQVGSEFKNSNVSGVVVSFSETSFKFNAVPSLDGYAIVDMHGEVLLHFKPKDGTDIEVNYKDLLVSYTSTENAPKIFNISQSGKVAIIKCEGVY